MKKLLLAATLFLSSLPAFGQNVARMLCGTNPQAGTTYTVAATDFCKLVTFSNSNPIAVTQPAGNTSGFGAGKEFSFRNNGTGQATFTCQNGCTINGSGTLAVPGGTGADLYSDGLNYIAQLYQVGGGGGGGACTVNPADGGCAIAGSPSVDLFIGSVGGGTGFLFQLLSNQLNINVPVNIAAGGSLNAISMPGSGANASSTANNNQGQFGFGTAPASPAALPSDLLPIAVAKEGNVLFASILEQLANKDQINGYASLNGTGQVPIGEVLASTAGCSHSTFVAGDLTCVAGSGNTSFAALLGGTSTGQAFVVGNGSSITVNGTGSVNATVVNGGSYPFCGPLNNCNLNSVPMVFNQGGVGSATFGISNSIPNCLNPGCALGFNASLHNWLSNNISNNVTHPMGLLLCNGTNNACPDTTPVTAVSGSDTVFEFAKVSAGTLSSDMQCINFQPFWKHSSGSATITYKWYITTSAPTQGNAIPGGSTQLFSQNCSNTGNCNNSPLSWQLHSCRANGSLISYFWTEQFQTNSASLALQFDPNVAGIDWLNSDQYIVLTFQPSPTNNTDQETSWGGMFWYP